MTQTVLVINSDSSPVEYRLVDPETGEAAARGLVEHIGDSLGNIKHAHSDEVTTEELPIPDHEIGMCEVLHLFDTRGPALGEAGVVTVGHYIVQDGKYFDGPVLATDEVHDLIEQLCPMTPLHNPAHLKDIDITRGLMPDVPRVAVFNTTFFQRLPDRTATYTLNAKVAEKYAVRRYDTHGTSHQFVSQEIVKRLGHDDPKQITTHLDNGTSVSAVLSGKPINTSVGLIPFEGLMMDARTGDIDPTVVSHLARQGSLSIDEIGHIFNKESGMKGLAGESDMRPMWTFICDDSGPELQHKARVAMDICVNRLLKYVGSCAVELGGLDVMSFAARIGESDSGVRREPTEILTSFGVKIDAGKNELRSSEPLVISVPDSKILLLVFPMNEEFAIAR